MRESVYFILSSYIYNVSGTQKIDYSFPIYSSSSNNEKPQLTAWKSAEQLIVSFTSHSPFSEACTTRCWRSRGKGWAHEAGVGGSRWGRRVGIQGGNFWEAAEPGGMGGSEGKEREVEELPDMKWRRACSTYSSLRQDNL